MFWRNNTGAYRPRPGVYLEYGEPGSSDFLCIQAPFGRFVAVETKREIGGQLDPKQIIFRDKVQAAGGIFVEARSPEDVHARLGPPTLGLRFQMMQIEAEMRRRFNDPSIEIRVICASDI